MLIYYQKVVNFTVIATHAVKKDKEVIKQNEQQNLNNETRTVSEQKNISNSVCPSEATTVHVVTEQVEVDDSQFISELMCSSG